MSNSYKTIIQSKKDRKLKKKDDGDTGDGANGNSVINSRTLQRIHHLFTFNNYLMEDISLLEIYLKEICVSYAFQREIGEKCHTPHLQGVISLKKRKRITELIYPKVHWGGEPVRNVGKAYLYATKEKTRVPGTIPYTYNYIVPEKLDLLDEEE